MSKSNDAAQADDIAIIGMSGRFPGARNIDEFWANLSGGVESISFFSYEELEAAGVDPELLKQPRYIRAKGALDDIDLFDAAFFDIHPREADFMDPQHRLFLECAWEALENAGYDPKMFKGRIGVFAGKSTNTYLTMNLYSNQDLIESVGAHQALLGNDGDYLTTWVSYKMGLTGPSLNVQTACSTSLVAVHLACQSLLNGECSMALAGGVSITLPQKTGYLYKEGGILSPDGHCRAFDADAQGCVEGSGVGLVVLKTLDHALACGDSIVAVIKGSAINNDGSLKAGYTAPSVEGQAEGIAEALTMADIDADTISYVETHGTGTSLGDPIEIAALTEAFRAKGSKRNSCAIGSVKTNIGHLDAAAGVAGLIKTALALKNKLLPPSLYFKKLNPKIDFDGGPFYVNAVLSEWRAGRTPRRAGVNSFGIGGTNAHIVLEEAPAAQPQAPSRTWQLLALSATKDEALDAATGNLAEYFRNHSDLNLADAAYTLHMGRRAFDKRLITVCRDVDDATRSLSPLDPQRVITSFDRPQDAAVVFMFPGQGSQYANMGRELYEEEGAFRGQVDRCSELFELHTGIDLRALLYSHEGEIEASDQKLTQTSVAQAALFTIEYALAKLWMSWGVQPRAMIGHSIGEYVAACLAGVFTLEDAVKLVAARGRLMQAAPPGAMLIVNLTGEEIRPLLEEGLSIAAINGQSSYVVSGPFGLVERLESCLNQKGVGCHRLHTSHAFHSGMMDHILEDFAAEVVQVKLSPPKIPYVSNLTGSYIRPEEATDVNYWARQLRQPVLFYDGVKELLNDFGGVLLEVGPGQTLSTLVKHHPLKAPSQVICSSLRRAAEQESDVKFLLTTLGRLWLAGVQVSWPKFYEGQLRRRIPLPTYPFQRQRYWIEPQKISALPAIQPPMTGKKPLIADWFYVPLWKQSLLPASVNARDVPDESPCWLILADEHGLGAAVARRLRQEGQKVTTLSPGERFTKLDDHTYIIDPRRAEDYETLLNDLKSAGTMPRAIAHLWSVLARRPDPESSLLTDCQEKGFYSLIFLAQALGNQNIGGSIDITVISDNLQNIAGEAIICPERATTSGVCLVIPLEYPNITCRTIDINTVEPEYCSDKKIIERLLNELAARSTDRVIAYRGDKRWVQTLEAAQLSEVNGRPFRVREAGVYLITGGLGGVGLELARYLAQVAKARLVLTGRSAFPDRSDWDQWLSVHDEQDSISRKIRSIQAIEESGAETMVFEADVTDYERMREVRGNVEERFGQINGVIHAAGVAGEGIIQLKDHETAGRVLDPKVKGTLVLDALFKGVELDFLVLCSSVTSITGAFGQADYCAANTFLNTFAQYKNSASEAFTVAIAWDAWKEVGMAVNAALNPGDRRLDYRQLNSPLLDKYAAETSEREIYLTEFSPEKHWVLDDHRIMGNPVIPGTTYLEMARAAFEKQANGREIEIREVYFVTPLRVPDGEKKEVQTVLEKDGDDYRFSMRSRDGSGSGDDREWQQHAMGMIKAVDSSPPKKHRIEQILERCREREVVFSSGKLDEDDGPRWQTLKSAHIGNNEILIALELPDSFATDLESFNLHPSLLDAATGTPKQFLGGGGAYLPLSYKRISLKAPLTKKVYSHARYKEDKGSNKETLTFDLVIMDEEGETLVEIEEFTAKRVNDAALKIKEWNEIDSREGSNQDAASQGRAREPLESHRLNGLADAMLSKEAIEAFARILNSELPPQVIVSTKDIQVAIAEAHAFTRTLLLNRTGAIGSAHSGTRHPRPDLQTPYVAPENAVEEKLCGIWQELFGIEPVGTRDNFFDLGGDSMIAVQIIARANQSGIRVTTQHIFEHQTVAELASVAGAAESTHREQALVEGPVALTPFQRLLLEGVGADLRQHGKTHLFEFLKPLDAQLLKAAARHLIIHHDALRLRFESAAGGEQQVSAGIDDAAQFDHIAIPDLPEAGQDSAILQAASRLRSSVNLWGRPLFALQYLESDPLKPGWLLLNTNDLITDEVSVRIVIEDLCAAYDQLSQGEAVELGPGPVSFKRWADSLAERAQAEALQKEADYWRAKAFTHIPRLPTDYGDATGKSSLRSIRVSLSADETETLLTKVHSAYHTKTLDVLMTALMQAFYSWTGEPHLLIALKGNYRQQGEQDLDLSRTVGQFAFLTLMLLELRSDSTPGSALKSVKEQLRKMQGRGLAHNSLKNEEINGKLQASSQAEVSFNYVERGDERLPDSSLIRPVRELSLPDNSDEREPRYLIEINAQVSGGRLDVDWTYRENLHQASTIQTLAGNYLRALRSLIAHCQSLETGSYTPSDFPLAKKLDERKLNRLSLLISHTDAS